MESCVLGISAFYHDSAAAIVRNGEIIAAAQEERFSRKKHDPRFPRNAVNFCLEAASIRPDELDAVVFYDNPLLTWDRVLKNSLQKGERSREQFQKAAKSVLGAKIWVREKIESEVGSLGKCGKLLVTEHHMSHAASAFYPSPFREAAIITLDGVGEWATSTVGVGRGESIELIDEIDYPHSIGLMYSAATYFCGFKVNSGEYKLMGLAPYGEPTFYETIRDNLIDIKSDGSFRLNTDYFGFLDSNYMTNDRFSELFGGPPRSSESEITRREMDIAASFQKVTEDVVLRIAQHAKESTNSKNLVLAGGVALNCVANGHVLRDQLFDSLWIQPAAGDAGGALGAALAVTYQYFGQSRKCLDDARDTQKGSYLGPAFSCREIEAFLRSHDYSYERIDDPDDRANQIARAISQGKIVGLFSGRMEFGPRALGARSILGDPRNIEIQSFMNLKVKYRESFRPFAPSVLAEEVGDYFELDCESPYMLLVAPVKQQRRISTDRSQWWNYGSDMRPIINQARSDVPAITHVDYSARVQTVGQVENPEFRRILSSFKKLTGCSVVVNTSFNVRGEPIVCTPKDAYACFMRTGIDLLVLEDYLLWKDAQPEFGEIADRRTEYELD